MRANLPHALRERRRSRANQHRREAARPAPATPLPVQPAHTTDAAVARVRSAGGPIDEASYACACGLVFKAPVSTTVACPHCHAPQAW